MNPIQFALQDDAVHQFIHNSFLSSSVTAWGWFVGGFLLLAIIIGFLKLYKGDKKSNKSSK